MIYHVYISIFCYILCSYRYIPWYTELGPFFLSSMLISRISRQWRIWPTTRTCLCAFYVSMHALATCRHARPCWTNLGPIQIQTNFKFDRSSMMLRHRPSQTAISMSPANRESAILHWSPCWTVEKWCGDQQWLYTMFILLYIIYILWYWCYVYRQTRRILLGV